MVLQVQLLHQSLQLMSVTLRDEVPSTSRSYLNNQNSSVQGARFYRFFIPPLRDLADDDKK